MIDKIFIIPVAVSSIFFLSAQKFHANVETPQNVIKVKNNNYKWRMIWKKNIWKLYLKETLM